MHSENTSPPKWHFWLWEVLNYSSFKLCTVFTNAYLAQNATAMYCAIQNFCSHTFVNAKWGWRFIGALQWGLIVVYKLVQLASHRSWQDRCVSQWHLAHSSKTATHFSLAAWKPTHTHPSPPNTRSQYTLQLSWQLTVHVTCLIALFWKTCASEWPSTQTPVGCVRPASYSISSFYIQNTVGYATTNTATTNNATTNSFYQ